MCRTQEHAFKLTKQKGVVMTEEVNLGKVIGQDKVEGALDPAAEHS